MSLLLNLKTNKNGIKEKAQKKSTKTTNASDSIDAFFTPLDSLASP
jgi:hypothetical protein